MGARNSKGVALWWSLLEFNQRLLLLRIAYLHLYEATMYQAGWRPFCVYTTGLGLRVSYFRELTNKSMGCCIVCTHKHNATFRRRAKRGTILEL